MTSDGLYVTPTEHHSDVIPDKIHVTAGCVELETVGRSEDVSVITTMSTRRLQGILTCH